MRSLILAVIWLYQKTLSPDHGWQKRLYPYGFCRYYPTCSEYACGAVEKFGVIKGLLYSCKRVLKCNPWAKPSLDLISEK